MLKFQIADEIDFEKITKTRLGVIKDATTWLMYSSFFRNLEEREKLLILKTTWHVWGRLELLSISVEIFGEKVSKEKVIKLFLEKNVHFEFQIVFISENEAVYLIEIFRNNLMNLDPKEAEDVDKEIQPLFTAVFDDVAVKLSSLNGSHIEVAYLLWQMIWCVAGEK